MIGGGTMNQKNPRSKRWSRGRNQDEKLRTKNDASFKFLCVFALFPRFEHKMCVWMRVLEIQLHSTKRWTDKQWTMGDKRHPRLKCVHLRICDEFNSKRKKNKVIVKQFGSFFSLFSSFFLFFHFMTLQRYFGTFFSQQIIYKSNIYPDPPFLSWLGSFSMVFFVRWNSSLYTSRWVKGENSIEEHTFSFGDGMKNDEWYSTCWKCFKMRIFLHWLVMHDSLSNELGFVVFVYDVTELFVEEKKNEVKHHEWKSFKLTRIFFIFCGFFPFW